jgi:hypothetical protein
VEIPSNGTARAKRIPACSRSESVLALIATVAKSKSAPAPFEYREAQRRDAHAQQDQIDDFTNTKGMRARPDDQRATNDRQRLGLQHRLYNRARLNRQVR